jgi:hypothetical protein
MLIHLAMNKTTRNDLLIVVLWGLLLVPNNYCHLDFPHNVGMIISPPPVLALLICLTLHAFSNTGFAAAFHFAYGRSR